ncbi:MltR family transcriptional regulator [Bacillus thuringiensis]|uniref:Mannitol operon repressor n=1 Tax=Bacillus thuringiensis HD-771 TaxID=1218175 RepID=A0A9W3JKA7_BACTU|nr:MltR family transcriptional regulator [Bacillus thuringiensis]AFQ16481.1 mannitol operon repressor [Bacillus thuringiensis HD-771]AND10499.1 transcriptional regulator [Bacillus thuringiensis serovar alesti]MEC2472494.1 MltR family transcriptional regulator [Bacillus thuringiensis]MEC3220838.1 MltR family transcriptional regulator [Bacillus thuringiensis]MEC3463091.1 MltR family transcriptional regulator [Bacillus thuringiensis]
MAEKMRNDFYERLTKNNEYWIAYQEFEKEFKNNSSDRGLVLVCGSIIDHLLSELLKSFLIKSNNVEKDLFKTGGILATFDSKIKMSYYLGLISKNEQLNITYLQRIRNKFAHQFINISFENNDIVNVCKSFEIPKNCFVPSFIPFPNKETGELPQVDLNPIKKDTLAKNRFIVTFQYLYFTFISRLLFAEFERRDEYTKIITAENIMLMQIEMIERALNKGIELKEYEENENHIFEMQYRIETIKKSLNDNNILNPDIQDTIKDIEIEIEKNKKWYEEFSKENDEYLKFLHSMLKPYRYSYEVLKNSITK